MILDWHAYAVAPDVPLLDALRVIDRGAQQFALVVDDGRLIGIVTDGDVRRALLRGMATTAPTREALNSTPVLGTEAEGPAGWRAKLRRHGIRHLPVVNADRQILRIVTDQHGQPPRADWVVVMAGGLGTRLRPITESIPKPMIEVGGRPILETIIDTLAHHGFRRVFLSVNYRAEMIESHFRDGADYGVEIRYLHEPTRLGTAGALSLLPREAETPPLLVMNGDILTGLDLGRFLDDHVEADSAITIGAREFHTQIPYGVLHLEGDRVASLREKPTVASTVSAGIYALSPSVLPLVPAGAFYDMPTLVSHAIERGLAVRAHVVSDYWIDVGRLDDLERARLDFEGRDRA